MIRELRFPSMGVVRRLPHEHGNRLPEYPTPWAINCRLEDTLEKRLRGGSRPGLTSWSGTSDSTLAGSTVGQLLPGVFPSGSSVTSVLVLGANTCSLARRGPKVYAVASSAITVLDPVSGDTYSLEASSGTVPTGCTVGCFYRDRLMVGGASNAVYVARQGDPTDWDYGADVEDPGRATVMQLGEASEVGGATTAVLPFHDASVLMATENALWLLQGDPVAGGSLGNLSRGVGIAGKQTWCPIHDAQVGDATTKFAYVFLSSLGLFMVSPAGDNLECISEDRIPDELRDIPGTSTVSMAYSPQDRGIWIFVTPASGAGTHFFFDLVRKAFWPMSLPTTYQPIAATWHDDKLIVYGQDGSLRYTGGTDDDGTALSSYVLIGPVRLAGPNMFGMLTTIHGMIGASSGTVLWKIIAGDTAEEACVNGKAAITAYLAGNTGDADAYVHASGAWPAGRSFTSYPRVRAMWICVLLTSSVQWAYESITIQSRDAGNWR